MFQEFEVYLDNTRSWSLFFPLFQNGDEMKCDYNTLPESVYGKYLLNTTGYNPSGWFRDLVIDKKMIRVRS
jgi:hypothetical protein